MTILAACCMCNSQATAQRRRQHLLSASRDHHIVCSLGISLYFDTLLAAGCLHAEAPYLGGVVGANLLLLSIEAHTLANEVVALAAPHVEGHLKADDKDPLVQLFGTLTQRVLALLLHIAVHGLYVEKRPKSQCSAALPAEVACTGKQPSYDDLGTPAEVQSTAVALPSWQGAYLIEAAFGGVMIG